MTLEAFLPLRGRGGNTRGEGHAGLVSLPTIWVLSIQGYDPIHLGFCFLPMASLFPQTRSFCLRSDEVLLFGSQPSPRVDHCLPSICSVSLYPGPSVAWIRWEIPLSQSQGFSLPFAEHLCAFLIVFLSHYLAVLKQVIPL